jgi:hypothetical protein
MKVKELIEQLQQCDPEAMVVSRGYEGGKREVVAAYPIKVALNVNTEWYYGKHEEINNCNDEYTETTYGKYEKAIVVNID